MTIEPEQHGIVVFRWTPGPGDKVTEYDDIALEYAVVENQEAQSGIMILVRYGDEWIANPWSVRPLVKQLLARITSCPLD